MARDKKKNKLAGGVALDLLGEAFGAKTKVTRKRTKSLERPKAPLLIGGYPAGPPTTVLPQQLAYTAPIRQTNLSTSMLSVPHSAQYPLYPQQPPIYTLPSPTERDFEQLKLVDAHFKRLATEKAVAAATHMKDGEGIFTETKTSITITKHVCANCGRIRSRKYHHSHPLKPGETPAPAFCKKCQRDPSSTSCSSGSVVFRTKKLFRPKEDREYKRVRWNRFF